MKEMKVYYDCVIGGNDGNGDIIISDVGASLQNVKFLRSLFNNGVIMTPDQWRWFHELATKMTHTPFEPCSDEELADEVIKGGFVVHYYRRVNEKLAEIAKLTIEKQSDGESKLVARRIFIRSNRNEPASQVKKFVTVFKPHHMIDYLQSLIDNGGYVFSVIRQRPNFKQRNRDENNGRPTLKDRWPRGKAGNARKASQKKTEVEQDTVYAEEVFMNPPVAEEVVEEVIDEAPVSESNEQPAVSIDEQPTVDQNAA